MSLLLKVLSIILFYVGLSTSFFSFCYDMCLSGVQYNGFEIIYNQLYSVDTINSLFFPIMFLNFLNLVFLILEDSKKSRTIATIFNALSIIYLAFVFFNSRGFGFLEILESIGCLIVIISNILFIFSYRIKYKKNIKSKYKHSFFTLFLTTFIFLNINYHNYYYKNEIYLKPNSLGGCDLATSHLKYIEEINKQLCVPNEYQYNKPKISLKGLFYNE